MLGRGSGAWRLAGRGAIGGANGRRAGGVAWKSSVGAVQAEAGTGGAEEVKPFSQMPGPMDVPFLGLMAAFAPYQYDSSGILFEDMMRDGFAKYGPVWKVGNKRDMFFVFMEDPNEFFDKVLQGEGKYPTGIFSFAWPITQFNERNKVTTRNPFLLEREEWREGRLAVNPHLFSPQAAKSYLPAIAEAAKSAVAEVKSYENNMVDFARHASIDMFCSVSLGIQLNATGGNAQGRDFVRKQINAIADMTVLQFAAPWAVSDWIKPFSPTWRRFEASYRAARESSNDVVDSALKAGGHGFMQAFVAAEKVDADTAAEMNQVLLLAAADTTSSFMCCLFYALGSNPRAQQELREELQRELNGADLHEGAKLPYLTAVLNETVRLVKPLPTQGSKINIRNDIEIGGFHVPAGANVFLSAESLCQGVDRPNEFLPERWLGDGPASRKGTLAALLDHPMIKEPFGHGPRKCVASRVAKLELKCILARLVQDYEFTVDPEDAAKARMVTRAIQMPEPFPRMKMTKL